MECESQDIGASTKGRSFLSYLLSPFFLYVLRNTFY